MAWPKLVENGPAPGCANSNLTVDQAGRVLIPKSLRDELRLIPGDVMALKTEGNEILPRPVGAKVPVKKEQGVWV